MSGSRLVAAAALTLVGAYHFVIRPWHRRWGSTTREARAPLPGDDLLPDATDQVTHAIEIDAPVEAVWPWLVQLGQGRGGFYSYDWLENAVGADIHNADRIVPEYQTLEEGDVVRLAPADYPVSSPESAPEVAHLETERTLVLRPPGESPAWTWAFVLEPVADGSTRLLARTRSNPGRSSIGPFSSFPALQEGVNYLFWEPAHFVMERGMLRGIRRRAEQMGRTAPSSTS
uniref:SRPBCC family protein n=1 Tax=Natrinema halophilum TaxID=1699371 RepID=A0A7D5H5B2_9EURY